MEHREKLAVVQVLALCPWRTKQSVTSHQQETISIKCQEQASLVMAAGIWWRRRWKPEIAFVLFFILGQEAQGKIELFM